MLLISVPHNLKTEVLSWPFPSRSVVPLEDKTVVLLSTMHDTEEINADSEKERLLLPVFYWFRLYANLTRYFRFRALFLLPVRTWCCSPKSDNVSTSETVNRAYPKTVWKPLTSRWCHLMLFPSPTYNYFRFPSAILNLGSVRHGWRGYDGIVL